MKNLKIKFGLLSFLVVLVASVFLTSCEQEVIEQPLITDYEKAEQILENYIVEENGTFVLSESDPYKLGIDPTVFNELNKGLEEMNKLIDKGEIKREWINKIIDMETLEEVDIRGCNKNDISWGLFSATVYISKSVAKAATQIGCTADLLEGIHSGLTAYIACRATINNANYCSCGYQIKVKYLGRTVQWVACQ